MSDGVRRHDHRRRTVASPFRTGGSLLRWGPVVAYMTAIFVVSSVPDPSLPADVSDKTAHVVAYLGLGVLVVRALAGGLPARVTRRTAVLALLITIGYGVTDEVHQMFVPGRFADLSDVYANAVGAAIGVIVCWGWGIIALRSTTGQR